MPDQNYFGYKKYSPRQIFESPHKKVCNFVQGQLGPLFKGYGDPAEIFQHIEKVFDQNADLTEIENKLNNFFETKKGDGVTADKLRERAKNIHTQIIGPLKEITNGRDTPIDIIDVGCGDGLVSHLLRTKAKDNNLNIGKTYLADTHQYLNSAVINNEDYPWVSLNEIYDAIPIQGQQFDCALLLTVLHHSENPRDVLRACYRLLKTNGIIIIIESCIGISKRFVETTESVLTTKSILEDNDQKAAVKEFLNLSEDEQFLYGTFIDWFYNRALHNGVRVPFNFNTPDGWNRILGGIGHMQHIKTYCEGFDQITVPEFHTLHVFKRMR